jgi:hypothetical protein
VQEVEVLVDAKQELREMNDFIVRQLLECLHSPLLPRQHLLIIRLVDVDAMLSSMKTEESKEVLCPFFCDIHTAGERVEGMGDGLRSTL